MQESPVVAREIRASVRTLRFRTPHRGDALLHAKGDCFGVVGKPRCCSPLQSDDFNEGGHLESIMGLSSGSAGVSSDSAGNTNFTSSLNRMRPSLSFRKTWKIVFNSVSDIMPLCFMRLRNSS